MDYYLVNNGYHIFDLLSLTDNCCRSLIVVPHAINIPIEEKKFSSVYHFPSPFGSSMLSWLGLGAISRAKKDLDSRLKINCNDRLFVYTEYELFNHFIIRKFASEGAKVYLVEEGLATYSLVPSKGFVSVKSLFGTLWVRMALGLRNSSITHQKSGVFPFYRDSVFSGLLSSDNKTIARSISCMPIKRKAQSSEKTRDNESIVFLSEPLYDYYMSTDEYLELIERIVAQLCAVFKEVLFKFHPREAPNMRGAIKKQTIAYPVTFLENEGPAEVLAQSMMFKYCASFICSALLPMVRFGVEPIFLIRLIKNYESNDVLMGVEKMLIESGVILPNSLGEIIPGVIFCSASKGSMKYFDEVFCNE